MKRCTASLTVDMNFKEQLGVKGEHVEQVIEEGRDDGDPDVDHDKKQHHLERTPERLQQLSHQRQDYQVQDDLPEVDLEEAVGEGGPDPEVGRPEVAGSHAHAQEQGVGG